VLGNVEAGGTGHNVIIARAHSSFSRVSAVAVAMIASLCAAARWRQGIEPLRSRSCVVFGEIPHLTLLLKTVEGQRNMRHVLYAAHPIPSKIRRYWQLGGPHASCRMPLDGFAVVVVGSMRRTRQKLCISNWVRQPCLAMSAHASSLGRLCPRCW
jgi:hypothetical protein